MANKYMAGQEENVHVVFRNICGSEKFLLYFLQQRVIPYKKKLRSFHSNRETSFKFVRKLFACVLAPKFVCLDDVVEIFFFCL